LISTMGVFMKLRCGFSCRVCASCVFVPRWFRGFVLCLALQ
jgi:hypothetical protein